VAHLLLIDDDVDFADDLREALVAAGHRARALDSAEEALQVLSAGEPFDLVLLDNRMPRMSGLEFLAAAGERGLRVPVVLMTSAHQASTAIQATNLGAFAYVLKAPPEQMLAELAEVIREAVEVSRRPPPVHIQEGPAEPEEETTLIGRSKPMLALLKQIARGSRLEEPVLILGETGTGKDLVARYLHTNSRRCGGPFVVMNCAAFNEQLLDDELFGHEPGAFTGAHKLRKGRFEHAGGGTLFLDEVGDMPPALQVKLLRVLENHEVVRIGSNDPIRVDVRVLAATHRDLPELVREKKFREDLLYRLEGMTIRLPPLRERREDVPLLASAFLARMFPDRSSRPVLHPLALERLCAHPWPGNVRQLQKVLCRAAGSCRGQQVLAEDVDFGELDREPAPAAGGLRDLIEAAWRSNQPDLWPYLHDRLQRELLEFALAQPGVSQVQLARRLGMSRNYLRARLKHFGLAEPADEG
jgi:DNA-binding NtrC family response regulator